MRFLKYAALTLLIMFVFCLTAGAEEAPQEELYRAESDSYCALRGDIDADGKVTAADARRILRCAVKLDVVDYSRQNAYNLDGVLDITASDARTALRVSVGLEARPAHEDAGSIVLQQATCAESGITAHQCKYCRDLYHFGVIPQQEHTGGGWVTVTKATCSEKGKKEQYCIYCGKCIDTQTLPTTPHVYGDIQYVDENPDCTKNQFVYEVCIYCGHREDRLRPATPHTYDWVTVLEPTCTTQGARLERCVVCGRDRLDGQIEILPTLGHQPSGWIVVQRVTYCGDGLRRIICMRCGEILEEETIKAVGPHSWTWVTDTAPTCVTAGVKHEACPVCHATRNEDTEIPATGIHIFTSQTVSEAALKAEATCTSSAEYYYSCSMCAIPENDDDHTFFSGDMLPHTWEWVVDIEPTCGAAGSKHEVCAVCGAVQSENTAIEATGLHQFTEQAVNEAALKAGATCTSAAEYYYSCAECGAVENDDTHTFFSGDMLPHTWEWLVDLEPTCGAAGSKHEVCAECGAVQSENTVIEATGLHQFTAQTVCEAALKTGATCTNAAVYYYSCAVCGAVEYDDSHTFTEGETLPHTWEWFTVSEPTCVEQGTQKERCAVCGAEREDGEERAVPALGHLPGEEKVVVEPTPENEGLKIIVCQRCGETLEEIVIPTQEP